MVAERVAPIIAASDIAALDRAFETVVQDIVGWTLSRI